MWMHLWMDITGTFRGGRNVERGSRAVGGESIRSLLGGAAMGYLPKTRPSFYLSGENYEGQACSVGHTVFPAISRRCERERKCTGEA